MMMGLTDDKLGLLGERERPKSYGAAGDVGQGGVAWAKMRKQGRRGLGWLPRVALRS